MDYQFNGSLLGSFDVKSFGAKGDGTTNDVLAVKAAFNYIKSIGGGTLVFPRGTYNLAAWTYPSYLVDFPLTITGYGEHTLLVGPKSPAAQPFLTNKANFACENISIDGFQDVFDFTPTTTMLNHIRINNVRFTDYSRAAVKWSENNVNGGCQRIYIENCRMLGINITPQYGLNLSTPVFQKLEINGNTIDNIAERGIYIGSTTLSLQDSRENVNITRNNVGNIYNPSTNIASEGTRAADGIQVMATNAIIADNYVYDIDNYAKQDCEGIYTKCKFAIIARNHLVNAGGGEAFIDIKGAGRVQTVMANCTAQTSVTTLQLTNLIYGMQVAMYIDILDSTVKNPDGTDAIKYAQRKVLTLDYPNMTIGISGAAVTTAPTDYIQKFARAKGYGVLCINNTLVDGRPWGDIVPGTTDIYNTTGIKINNDDVKVEGNLLEGFTYNAIAVGGSTYSNIDIRNNKIRKIRGIGGIGAGGLGRNFVIDNNQISEVTGETTSGTCYGINVGGSATDLVISNNQIDSIKQNGVYTTTNGISVRPTSLLSVSNVTIKNNVIKTVGRGIAFTTAAMDDAWVYGNKVQDCPTPIYYSAAPTNIVIGTNNPTLALPAPIDPSTLTGLKAWFDATAITGITDGAAIASWTDRSATAAIVIQDDPLARPTYTANALNGKAGVSFGGSHRLSMVLPSPTTAPVLAQSANVGATITAGTYYVAYSWRNSNGDTLVSPEASINLTTGNQLDVTIPALPTGAANARICMGTVSGTLYSQTSSLTTTTFSRSSPISTTTVKPTVNVAYVGWAAAMTQPNTIFLVARLDTGYMFDGIGQGARQYFRSSSIGGSYYYGAGTLVDGTTLVTLSSYPIPSDGNFHMFTLRAKGVSTSSSIKVDGTTTTGDATGALPQSLTGLVLGSLYNGSFATGKLCEILVYDADLSAYNQAQVEFYLKQKWAL